MRPMLDVDIVCAVPYLKRYALKLSRNLSDAEDLVSMTTLIMLEKIRGSQLYIEKPNPYMAKVMYNVYVRKIVGQKKAAHYEDWMSGLDSRQENILFAKQCLQKFDVLENPDRKIVASHIDGSSVLNIVRTHKGFRTGRFAVTKIINNFQELCLS